MERDTCRGQGPTSNELAELKRLRWENAELQRANDMLKAAAHLFRSVSIRAPQKGPLPSTAGVTKPGRDDRVYTTNEARESENAFVLGVQVAVLPSGLPTHPVSGSAGSCAE